MAALPLPSFPLPAHTPLTHTCTSSPHTPALAATSSLIESKMGSTLKSFLKTNMVKKEITDELGVADAKVSCCCLRGAP